MKMLTDQEVFVKVATHLFKQGHRSESSTGICLYRGPNGDMCAIGCLIPDEKYEKCFENKQIDLLPPDVVLNKNIELLQYLQSIHDDYDEAWETTRDMRGFLRRTAKLHKLDFSPVAKLSFGKRRKIDAEKL